MITFESTLLEKLFHEDQPMGGGVTEIWFALDLVCWSDDGEGRILGAAPNNDRATIVKRRLDLGTNERKLTANAAIPAAARTDRFSIFSSIRFFIVRFAGVLNQSFISSAPEMPVKKSILNPNFRSRPLACASYAFPSLNTTNSATGRGPRLSCCWKTAEEGPKLR